MYISSVEFTDFHPFAPGSRMTFAPVPDKPDDLAEVHLITGENGTGKSRLLCLLAAALGDAKPLQWRCAGSGVKFKVGFRPLDPADPEAVMALRMGREGLEPEGSRSAGVFSEAREIPAVARSGVNFLEDAPFTSALNEAVWLNDRLSFRPPTSHSESLLRKLHKFVIAARLQEDAALESLVRQFEEKLSDVLGGPFSFAPRSVPVEQLCVKWKGLTLSINQCPEGLRGIISLLCDPALMFHTLELTARESIEKIRQELAEAEDARAAIRKGDEFVPDPELGPQDAKYEKGLELYHLEEFRDHVGDKLEGHTYRFDRAFQTPIILLDEIETHLHPGWQRQVLPAFQKMFPKAQIFVATHSPFVISSLNYGRVHILKRGAEGVHVDTHPAAKGDSYMTAVQEVLGLTGWFDAAVEDELGDFELLLDKAYTSNGASEAEMRSRAAYFLNPENRYSEEVRSMVMTLLGQYDRHRAVAKPAKP